MRSLFRTLWTLFSLALFLAALSCTKEEFTRTNNKSSVTIDAVKVVEVAGCARYSPPPLDILLLVDNSLSVNYLNANLPSLVSSIIRKSQQFKDYRIYIAPLIGRDNETDAQKQQYQLVSNDCRPGENLNIDAKCVAPDSVLLPVVESNIPSELGFKRVQDLLALNSKQNIANAKPVFRAGSYKMVILLSNGNDTDLTFDGSGNTFDTGQFEGYFQGFLNYSSSALSKSLQLRFISIVNFSKCGSTVKLAGTRYTEMSRRLYQAQGITDSPGLNPDSYDMCTNSVGDLFARVATTIDKFKTGHVYNFWPIGDMNGVDPTKLEAMKSPSGEKLILNDLQNGFKYVGYRVNQNIRESPVVSNIVPKEIYNDHFLELFGEGKVTFPECLYVKKPGFTKYYGYAILPDQPDLNYLTVKINGNEISQGAPNGWVYLGFKQSTNLLVNSPTDLSPITPGIFKTGYVLKFYGSSVYQDGSLIEIVYKKAKQ
jgi:hypothetical protein